MSFITLSPNMSLPVPGVGQEAGPQFALDINSCLAILDSHDHAPGSGVQITPTGLNINSDLPLNDNNLISGRTVRLSSQSAPLSLASDIDCIYVVGDDLYYNDGLGNQVRITQSGAVAGTPGSIANLTSPASASYVALNQTFVWQSDVNTAANLDAGSIILRKLTASSNGITLSVPSSIASDYTITLPALPASTLPLSISSAGAMSAAQITNAQLSTALQTKINTLPTIQVLTSGTTYTTPANVTYLKIRMIGGGGGGGAAEGSAGGAGGNTTFGTSFLTCNGGSGGGGGVDGIKGGAGGTATINGGGATGIALTGGAGNGAGRSGTNNPGSTGGGGGASSPFGGAGGGGANNSDSDSNLNGFAAVANTGSGGGGGSDAAEVNGRGGSGGGAGGYIDCIVVSPSASYTYAIGAGGAGSSGGSGRGSGGAGGSGIIIVEEHYGS